MGKRYYYDGKTLKDYCNDNHMNYMSICTNIQRLKRKYPNKDRNEILKIAITTYGKGNIKYIYKGESLYDYCKNNGLDYGVISNKFINHLWHTAYYHIFMIDI